MRIRFHRDDSGRRPLRAAAVVAAGVAGALAQALPGVRTWVPHASGAPSRGALRPLSRVTPGQPPPGSSRGRFALASTLGFQILSLALACQGLARSAVALCAAAKDKEDQPQSYRRRRRKEMLKTPEEVQEELRAKGLLAKQLKLELKVTDEELKTRREERRIRRQKLEQAVRFDEDSIYEVTSGPDAVDPDLFGYYPFYWVQIGHSLLLFVTLAQVAAAGRGIQNALFDIEGGLLETVRTGLGLVFIINLVNAAITYKEEYDLGVERGEDYSDSAKGWFLKGIFLGGISSWQRIGRGVKAEKKERDAEIDQVIEALKSQPDGTMPIRERIGEQGRLIGAGVSKEKLLAARATAKEELKERMLAAKASATDGNKAGATDEKEG
eukprot:TRINITY_DN56835_c0_g1_i1.p1 TRINITY_DN56835_c0_g1~~TRINITY_DN56835_c0_g1_i1.p1  ORF type:complete len:383 (+),score=85.00 TRINITY_DN56835_c0_g1_i1:56-1204(+)